jgi:hypothetical protein
MIIGIAKWLIYHIPARLLAEPERFALAFGLTLIGADAAFLGAPSSVLGQIPEASVINLEVGLFLFTGGICKLIGLWRVKIWLQRLGAAFLLLGCLGLVIGIILYGNRADIPVALVFGMLAITYGLRLLSSTAERIKLYRRPEDRD